VVYLIVIAKQKDLQYGDGLYFGAFLRDLWYKYTLDIKGILIERDITARKARIIIMKNL
jgi:hypothetical protein